MCIPFTFPEAQDFRTVHYDLCMTDSPHAMTPSTLQSQLRHRRHGYAWARRFIAGLTICLALLAATMDRDTLVAAPATASPAPEMITAPSEPTCPSQAKTAVVGIVINRAMDALPLPGRAG